MSRRITLEVLDGEGTPLGVFRCTVATPWLQEVADVLAEARGAGLELSVLRLRSHAAAATPDGPSSCTYLAEALWPPPSGVLDTARPLPAGDGEHPLRLPYARLGGNARDIAWADEQLGFRGLRRTAPAEQQRTWNLSCVHRLPLAAKGSGTPRWAWLKAVPPFFRQEGAVIAALQELDARTAPSPRLRLPTVLGFDPIGGRVLLAHCDGPLMWGCTVDDWRSVVQGHVDRQWRSRSDLKVLIDCGVPDWRGPALLAACRALVAREDVLAPLAADERSALHRLVGELPERLATIAACGLPDALVHGDLHQGNVIAAAEGPVLLDWGDAGVGHPLLDVPALCHGFDRSLWPAVHALVADAWQARVPGADVPGALAAMAPVMALRQALIYRTFLDGIEPAERHYHAADVPDRLRAALEAAGPRTGPRA